MKLHIYLSSVFVRVDWAQDAVAYCVFCPCWNCDYTLKTTHSRENSLHKLRIDNELKLTNTDDFH